MQNPPARRIPRPWLILLALIIILFTTPQDITLSLMSRIFERLPDFATIFLGIFIEAAPFLLFGTLGSGLVEIFFSQDLLARLIPKNNLSGTIIGGLMGLVFPVCECGVVPLTRRMFRKGLPLGAGIAFLLAAPVLNPIVLLSTASAFGPGLMLALRAALSLIIAISTGLIFSSSSPATEILKPAPAFAPPQLHFNPPATPAPGLAERWRSVLAIALDEFFEMGRYLVIGALLATAMQTFLPQNLLVSIGKGPILSVIAMMLLAVLLSICSTVDAFVALGFIGIFSPGAILAFLVFGPMVDIKSALMYARVFNPRALLYLILFPFLLSLLAGILVNYYLPGL